MTELYADKTQLKVKLFDTHSSRLCKTGREGNALMTSEFQLVNANAINYIVQEAETLLKMAGQGFAKEDV